MLSLLRTAGAGVVWISILVTLDAGAHAAPNASQATRQACLECAAVLQACLRDCLRNNSFAICRRYSCRQEWYPFVCPRDVICPQQ